MTIDDSDVNTQKPPIWMDQEYLLKPLRDGLEAPELEILSLNMLPATGKGDNYASQMFRASLSIRKKRNAEPERLSIVVKTLPSKGKATEMMQTWSIFKKEATMLTEILPRINKILADTYDGYEPLSAKCIWFGDDPEEVIILDDLKELGFSNADRRSGLDYDLANVVLKKMAHYHAASYALIQREPEQLNDFRESMWSEKYQGDMKQFFESVIRDLVEEIKTWKEVPQDYIPRLQAIENDLLQKVFDLAIVDENVLNVLQHGDCWTNNFMFRRNDKNVSGFRFVDFQLCYLNSAAMDLNYFIFTSPKSEYRTEKIDEMISTYYTAFMTAINDMNITLDKPFSLEQLKEEFVKRLHFGLLALCFVFPITVLAPKNALDINDFLDEDKSNKQLYQSDAFKEGILKALPYFIENGAL